MARYHCFSCGKNLDGHPKIEVEGNVNCFSCAKKAVAALDYHTELKHAQEVKAHDAEYEKWKQWDEKRQLAQPSPKFLLGVIFAVAGLCAFFMANPVFFFLPGLVVGFILSHIFSKKEKEDWARKNPAPVLPKYPSNNFVRDRIKLIGATSCTPLSSGYRDKILKRDEYRCQNCDKHFQADKLEVHHIQPQAKGGRHYPSNLVTLCYLCHVNEIWFGHRHKMRKRLPKFHP